jgi:hypothetical protein
VNYLKAQIAAIVTADPDVDLDRAYRRCCRFSTVVIPA